MYLNILPANISLRYDLKFFIAILNIFRTTKQYFLSMPSNTKFKKDESKNSTSQHHLQNKHLLKNTCRFFEIINL